MQRYFPLIQGTPQAIAAGAAWVVIATLLGALFLPWLTIGNISLLYVAGIVFVGVQGGLVAAITTAIISFLSFNFFLTSPQFTFRVDSQDDIITLVFMMAFSLLVAPAASLIRKQIITTESLRKAKLETEMEQLKNALLSSVSHDLRSPLSAIMGSAEMLRDKQNMLSDSNKHDLVSGIYMETKRLDKYIQNLLDMTRLGYGELELQRDWVTLGDIIASLTKRLMLYPVRLDDNEYRHGPQIDVALHDNDALLYVHAALIEQALFNIVENCCRFAPVNIPVRVRSYLITADTLRIEIEDEGPGIPEGEEEQIFTMFFSKSSNLNESSSRGMGLAISRGMLGAHGASLNVDTEYAMGARFIIDLPMHRNESS
ncbi:DUF4118 domain-containing protein [Aliidiomarina sp.]|uniref:sensor histidine kinase n=1 Tax=Aliidiomarina sp. TaxID=1872439 RepID=UPI003A4D39EF